MIWLGRGNRVRAIQDRELICLNATDSRRKSGGPELIVKPDANVALPDRVILGLASLRKTPLRPCRSQPAAAREATKLLLFYLFIS